MNRQEAKAVQQAFKAVEDWGLDMVTAVMDSFAARIREEARHPDNSHATQAALLAVARSAETTAQGIREEARRRQSPPPILKIKETETDG